MALRSPRVDLYSKDRSTDLKSRHDRINSSTDKLSEFRKKLEDTFKSPRNADLSYWDKFRSDARKKVPTTLSTSRLAQVNDLSTYRIPTPRKEHPAVQPSPLARYKTNPDLLYKQLLGSRNSSPPSSSSFTSPRSKPSSLSAETRPFSRARSSRSINLQEILKIDDILKIQNAMKDITDSEVSKLPGAYLDELRSMAEEILKKTRTNEFY